MTQWVLVSKRSLVGTRSPTRLVGPPLGFCRRKRRTSSWGGHHHFETGCRSLFGMILCIYIYVNIYIYLFIYDSSHLTIIDSFGRYTLPFCIPFLAERDPLQHLRPDGGAPPAHLIPRIPRLTPNQAPFPSCFPGFFMVFRC